MHRIALLQKWKQEEQVSLLKLLNTASTGATPTPLTFHDLKSHVCPACDAVPSSPSADPSRIEACSCCCQNFRRERARASHVNLSVATHLQSHWRWLVDCATCTVGASRAWYLHRAEVALLKAVAALGHNLPNKFDPPAELASRLGYDMYYERHVGVVLRRVGGKEDGRGIDISHMGHTTLGPVWPGCASDPECNVAFNLPAMSHACIVCSGHPFTSSTAVIEACSALNQKLQGVLYFCQPPTSKSGDDSTEIEVAEDQGPGAMGVVVGAIREDHVVSGEEGGSVAGI